MEEIKYIRRECMALGLLPLAPAITKDMSDRAVTLFQEYILLSIHRELLRTNQSPLELIRDSMTKRNSVDKKLQSKKQEIQRHKKHISEALRDIRKSIEQLK